MKKANRIVSFDWSMYDQGHVVYRPAQMSAGRAPHRSWRRLWEFLFGILNREPISAARQAPSRAMADLQSFHAQSLAGREELFAGGADARARGCSNASDPAASSSNGVRPCLRQHKDQDRTSAEAPSRGELRRSWESGVRDRDGARSAMGTLIVIAPSVRTIVAMISRDDNRDHCVGILGERVLRAVVAGAARVLDSEEPFIFISRRLAAFPIGFGACCRSLPRSHLMDLSVFRSGRLFFPNSSTARSTGRPRAHGSYSCSSRCSRSRH